VLVGIFVYVYVRKKVIKPFGRLKGFARQVAQGDLDSPLEMDKSNLFGAFTESFDIMREELREARKNEIAASKSKKELVASLAHDINTPVASVSSAIDILRLKAADEGQLKLLDSAALKLVQIDVLVTNLFESTLEELQELKVSPVDMQSTDIYGLIKQADYDGRCLDFALPDCLVTADALRLQQVFDNIIKNSYKYANTDISINAFIDENRLLIEVKDFGAGVGDNELPLLTGKFYRGANTENTDGHGLGLFLAKSFMGRMGGGLYLENRCDGFVVGIVLTLV